MKIAQIFVEIVNESTIQIVPPSDASKRRPFLLTRYPLITPICPVVYYEPRPRGHYRIFGHRIYQAEAIGATFEFVLLDDPPDWAEVLVKENERFQQPITSQGDIAPNFHHAATGLDGEKLLRFMQALGQPPKTSLVQRIR